MCGIVGYIGKREVGEVLMRGLKILENRGYDSAGIAALQNEDVIRVTKYASTEADGALDLLDKELDQFAGLHIGVAHTRWATHGGKTDMNAHPHLDTTGRLALVHNGVIENVSDLRAELQQAGIDMQSETDTEVIVQLIGLELRGGKSTEEAIDAALLKLRGTWGLAILDRERPDTIFVACNGSPIVVGSNADEVFIASEPTAFQAYTNSYIALEDGDRAALKIGEQIMATSKRYEIEGEAVPESPDPYPHWTLKEIYEQPEALSRALNFGGRFLDDEQVKLGGLESQQGVLLKVKHLVIAACGTSRHAGLYVSRIMRDLHSFDTVQVIDASELSDAYFVEGSGLLVISQSGETKDVHRAVKMAQKRGVPVFSVVNKVRSLIARETGCGVYLNAGHELGVASTKAFTTQAVVLTLIAIWFAQKRDQSLALRKKIIRALHGISMQVGSLLRIDEDMKALATEILDQDHAFILGKLDAHSIALEAALKIKEISYMHAEGYAGGALKHGPFALIEEGTPVIMLMPENSSYDFMVTAAEEVKARGARVIAITDAKEVDEHLFDRVIKVPNADRLTALLTIIPIQLLAYHLSVLRGHNPDKPRNLAKAVTVD